MWYDTTIRQTNIDYWGFNILQGTHLAISAIYSYMREQVSETRNLDTVDFIKTYFRDNRYLAGSKGPDNDYYSHSTTKSKTFVKFEY